MNNKFKSKSYFKSKPRFNSNFIVRYPDIIVKHDDKVAKDFFISVITGDVDNMYDELGELRVLNYRLGINQLHSGMEA